MRKFYACILALVAVIVSVNYANAQCTPTPTQTFTNSTPVAIPSSGLVTSTIVVSGAPTYLYDLNVTTFITHTWSSDLDITITSPSGTIITLTTDNGSSYDNVFNGTVWDDDANPGGLVPYTSNNGLVTDHSYVNLTLASPLVPEENLGAFIGENPNGTWTISINDDTGGDSGNLASWSLAIQGLSSVPTITNFPFTNSTPVAIPTGPGVVTSTIVVSGAGTQLIDLNVLTDITHTYSSDLDITITSPAGTVVTLTTDNGSSYDNVYAGTFWDDDANPTGIVPYTTNNGLVTDHSYTNLVLASPLAPEEALAAFVGENPNGTWTITISDDRSGDGGTLNSWGLEVRTSVCSGIPNDDCSSATTINCGQTLSGTNVGALADAAPFCNSGTIYPGVWYKFTGVGGTEVISTCSGASFDTKISVYSGTCGALVCVAGNDDFCGLQSQVSFTSTIGATYYVFVHGFAGATGTFNLSRACPPPCSGVPSPGAITPSSSSVCVGTPVILTLSGYSNATGLTFQWKESTTPGGPYTNISGATNNTYTTNATGTRYFVCTVTCTNPGGGSATTTEVVVYVSNLVHSNLLATPAVVCSPGATTISATVSGSAVAGNYTHTLTGPGTIGAPSVSGPNNSNVSFAVNGLPAGVHSFTLTSTNPLGCSVVSNVSVTVNQTPIITLITNPAASSGACTENFDGQAAPALPSGWSATFGANCGPSIRWAASTASFNSAPNAAFTNDPNCISDEYLNSKTFAISSAASQLSFRRSHIMETGSDGMVLEISIGGGPWTDIITAGGSFVSGGYTHTISSSFGSPISGRQAWSGNSSGWQTTVVNLPAAANGQNVVLRWRRATDNSVGSTGVYIDDISLTDAGCGSVVICNGSIVRIDATALPAQPQTFTSSVNTHIPAGGNTSGNASPYPNTISVSGLIPSGVTVKSVTLTNFSHTFPDDADIVLVSPSGQSVILMSDAGGSAAASAVTYTFDDAAAANMQDNAANPSGSYKPTNYGAGDTWPAPGPGASPSSTTLGSIVGNPNGNWSLYVVDDRSGDIGFIATWSLALNVPQPVVFSPTTNLFTDVAATIPYTGVPAYTVWARPAVNSTYTASSTIQGCSNTASVNIVVNYPPAVTSHPVAMPAPVCPGFNVNYSVTATGTSLTYQWQVSTNNGSTWANISDGLQYSGTTTATLTVLNVATSQNGHQFRCVVSGVCPPSATSNSVTLVVATAPVINSQPASKTVCAPDGTTFSVTTSGVPTPNIYQWQVSTTGAAGPWVNLTTGGSYTPTLTVGPTTTSMNGYLYRVVVTNSCGQSTTSSNATLTVNAPTPVTVTALPSSICLSDTLVKLNATPVGGSWSGLGVSGFNFIPTSTAVGSFTLTYTYVNSVGCTSTGTVVANVKDCPERIRLLDENGVRIFPNPNNGHFNIRVNSVLYNRLGMRVYTPAGQLVRTETFNGLVFGRVIPVDLSSLPSGTYMVKIFYDDGVRTSENTFPVVINRD